MLDPGLFVHPGKGRFNPGAPAVLLLELRCVLSGPPGGDPQGFEVKAKIMTLLPRFDRTPFPEGTDVAMLRIKGNAASVFLALLVSHRRMPMRTGGDLPVFSLCNIAQIQGFFLRCPHRWGYYLNAHLFCLFAVFVAAIQGIRQNLCRSKPSLFCRFQ